MRKKLTIIIIALVVIFVGVGAYFIIRATLENGQGTGTQGTGDNLLPIATGTVPNQASTSTTSFPSTDSFQIGTGQGVVTVKNFYKTDAYITNDQQVVVLVENDNYSIVYDRDDSGFIIDFVLVPDSLETVRTAAEADLLNQLGVSHADACKLNVDERVTDKTNTDYGVAMGLSFCDGPSVQ